MANQIILAVDDNGNFLEYIHKEAGHKGAGKRHLAVTVLLVNSRGQVLLQKRKHQIFDNIWDFTGATHPLHKSRPCHSERSEESISSMDETLEEATRRCLQAEYGIKDKIPLKNLGFFNYFAPYHTVQGDFCENEHCAMMVGEYNGEVNLDPKAGYEYKWMEKQQFLKDVGNNPQNYAPWAVEGIKVLRISNF